MGRINGPSEATNPVNHYRITPNEEEDQYVRVFNADPLLVGGGGGGRVVLNGALMIGSGIGSRIITPSNANIDINLNDARPFIEATTRRLAIPNPAIITLPSRSINARLIGPRLVAILCLAATIVMGVAGSYVGKNIGDATGNPDVGNAGLQAGGLMGAFIGAYLAASIASRIFQ